MGRPAEKVGIYDRMERRPAEKEPNILSLETTR